jgi:sugar lactone lactonase YvrE
MQVIDCELRSRGREERMALYPLLSDKNRFIRYYAAKYLLGLAPDHARRVIEEIAKFKFDALCLDAGMCLYALDKGIYRPD